MLPTVLAFLLVIICLPHFLIASYDTKTKTSIRIDPKEFVTHRSPIDVKCLRGIQSFRCGFGGGAPAADADVGTDDSDGVEISGSPAHLNILDGLYKRTDWDMNGRSHFEKTIRRSDDSKGNNKAHLYWSGSQWVIHYDLDPSRNFQNLLAYAKVKAEEVEATKFHWFVKTGQSFESYKTMYIGKPGESASQALVSDTTSSIEASSKEVMGVPRALVPFYIAFMLDAIATGIAMPLLPFYVMELGATAMQLSLVISSNYVAQMIGCIVMGRVSDFYGRRVVLTMCLAASSLSYFAMSHAKSLRAVACAKIIAGSFGGLVPIMQSGVADVSSTADRPKYIGRIMATFGMGFVLGPALSALMPAFSTREKVRMAALLPLSGLIVAVLFAKETKKETKGVFAGRKTPVGGQPIKLENKKTPTDSNNAKYKAVPPVSPEVLSLVVNGFLLMYAFSTESIYAMFIKDSFGYGERVLSTLFAINGLFIGIFQVIFIKPMISRIGKHATLGFGNLSLAFGMVGVALVRQEVPHFVLFATHVVGYSIADTALASLIARYSTSQSQGRDFALNQAAQSCARILSPLIAGLLYERSKGKESRGALPMGALPFLVGAMCPAVAVAIPSLLYVRSVARKREAASKGEKKSESDKVG